MAVVVVVVVVVALVVIVIGLPLQVPPGLSFGPTSCSSSAGSTKAATNPCCTLAGSLRWKFNTNNWISISSPVLGADGTVYVGSLDGYLYAIDTAGSQRWNFKTNGTVFSSPVLGADGTVYVGSWDGYLYAIDTAGGQRWKFKTNDFVVSSPVLGADGTVYVGSDDGYLYAIYTGANCSCPAGTYVNATSRFTSCSAL